ncbi:hypothetical protein LRS71_06960 [Rhodococcus pyridinivorans]|uniref:hypothetical protein n=1 Tax=Rhodococcus pyridinivorans TaxID=103816 RepID=UPI001E2954AC|nr:hypothetical protein [Rhodococcus pyridinivorans]MCD5419299.1 hypothetical protein [Rhodococcus pyridinivorans]
MSGADTSLVDVVRASRLVLASIDQDSDHYAAVLAECAADPYGDGVDRLIGALVSQVSALSSMATGGDPSRFMLDVLATATAPGAEESTDPEGGS